MTREPDIESPEVDCISNRRMRAAAWNGFGAPLCGYPAPSITPRSINNVRI